MPATNTVLYQMLAGILMVVALAWFANTSNHVGNIAVSIIIVFAILWAMHNAGPLGSLTKKLGF